MDTLKDESWNALHRVARPHGDVAAPRDSLAVPDDRLNRTPEEFPAKSTRTFKLRLQMFKVVGMLATSEVK